MDFSDIPETPAKRRRNRSTMREFLDKPGKPRKKPDRKEDKLHEQVAKLLTAIIAKPGVASADHVLWYSVETRARRSMREGAANKKRGCIRGVPDIDVYFGGRAYKIELKAPDGVLSDDQRELHLQLEMAGVSSSVARSIEDVLRSLAFWRIPHRRVS